MLPCVFSGHKLFVSVACAVILMVPLLGVIIFTLQYIRLSSQDVETKNSFLSATPSYHKAYGQGVCVLFYYNGKWCKYHCC